LSALTFDQNSDIKSEIGSTRREFTKELWVSKETLEIGAHFSTLLSGLSNMVQTSSFFVLTWAGSALVGPPQLLEPLKADCRAGIGASYDWGIWRFRPVTRVQDGMISKYLNWNFDQEGWFTHSSFQLSHSFPVIQKLCLTNCKFHSSDHTFYYNVLTRNKQNII
jgi:hypothetical protein